MASLKIRDVKKSYGDLQVMHGVDLDVEEGEFVVFVGPSGCGKSTLLRMIAGLEEVTSGEISIGDKVVNEVAPAKRGDGVPILRALSAYDRVQQYGVWSQTGQNAAKGN